MRSLQEVIKLEQEVKDRIEAIATAMEESYAPAEVAAPSLYERFLPSNWWTWDR